MSVFYPFLITFIMIFLSELGDKTQLLVLSFSTKDKAKNILIGVALGTFLSHGLAILFGSHMATLENSTLDFSLKIITYSSFLLFGFFGFLPRREKIESSSKHSFLQKLSHFPINSIFLVTISIVVGEIGDKTFLASLGLGLQYPQAKLFLILGSIAGMVASNSIAIFFGKLLGSKIQTKWIELLSNTIFIVFGVLGFLNLFFG